VDLFLQSIGKEVPGHLHEILAWDFIPWDYVKKRHGDAPNDPLVALLDAYSQLADVIDLEALCSRDIPDFAGNCLRCGSCCAYMRPGTVSSSTYRKWQEMGAPVARFYSPFGKKKRNPTYNCWYNNGIRLRLCPFMFVNRNDLKPFCAIHHLGRDHRPRACSRFSPNPPLCQTGQFVFVP
jgi:hypothetical protein